MTTFEAGDYSEEFPLPTGTGQRRSGLDDTIYLSGKNRGLAQIVLPELLSQGAAVDA